MTRILIVEDEPDLAALVKDNLDHEGFDGEIADTGATGLARASSGDHQCILLDLMLPDISGLDVLRELRRRHQTPVIIVSARSQEADILVGLELGADDYVTKPFSMRELCARIRALLRRTGVTPETQSFLLDHIEVDFRQRRLTSAGRVHALSHTENEVLRTLIENRGRPVTRSEILDAVWGEGTYPSNRTVDNFILRLRGKLEPDPKQPRYLLTVHGVGYQFVECP